MSSYQQLTGQEFFGTIGRMDAHPVVDENTLKQTVHVSIWRLRNQTIVGKTEHNSHNGDRVYYKFIP